MMKPIGIIAGDPNSINSEIIGKMWKQKSTFKNINIFVIGNFNLLKKQLKALKININIKKINTIKNQNFKKKLLILDVPLSFKKPFNVQNKVKVKYILNSFDMAIKMSLEKKILGFIKAYAKFIKGSLVIINCSLGLLFFARILAQSKATLPFPIITTFLLDSSGFIK